MELLISRQTPLFPSLSSSPLEETLKGTLRTVLQREGVPENAEISLVLCDDPFIQTLNAQYRGMDQPTDVLSFGQETHLKLGVGESLILGDIVISLPTAARQAERVGWALENEVVLLTLHGCLHLLGYDDETADGAARMQRKAAVLLSEIGIPPPVEGSHPFFVEYL